MDGPVARREDEKLAKVLDQFVTVRVVQMWDADLARYQFDWDQTFAAIFLNADGKVYARYGSAGRESTDTVEGFRKAAEGALELHAGYPANAKDLEGKQPEKPKWATPESMPALKGKPNTRPANGERMGCIHCHQVHEGEVWSRRGAGQAIPDSLLWMYPEPKILGFSLEKIDRATVAASTNPPFKAGDRILKLGGQPIVSIADVQWVLQQAEEKDLEAVVDRNGEILKLQVPLPKGWRRREDFGDRTLNWSLRNRLAGTGKLERVTDRGKEPGMKAAMELKITRMPPDWVKDRNPTAAKQLKDGDVITAVDGRVDLRRECDFFAYLLQQRPPGSAVKLTVQRGGKTIDVTITLP